MPNMKRKSNSDVNTLAWEDPGGNLPEFFFGAKINFSKDTLFLKQIGISQIYIKEDEKSF
jgi:hypothetical protein